MLLFYWSSSDKLSSFASKWLFSCTWILLVLNNSLMISKCVPHTRILSFAGFRTFKHGKFTLWKNNVVSMHGLPILKSRFHCHSYSKCYSILRWDKIAVIIMRLTKASWNHLTTVMDVTSEFYFNLSSIFASLVQEWGIFANRNSSKL